MSKDYSIHFRPNYPPDGRKDGERRKSLIGIFETDQFRLEISHIVRGPVQGFQTINAEQYEMNKNTETHEVIVALKINGTENARLIF